MKTHTWQAQATLAPHAFVLSFILHVQVPAMMAWETSHARGLGR